MTQFIKQGRFLVLMFMLLGCLAIQASDDLITKQITIKLDEAGTLPTKIREADKYRITNLKLVGKINGTDVKYIREMIGRTSKSKETKGSLSILDMSEVKVEAGGEVFCNFGSTECYTENNNLGRCVFYMCNKLTNLTLPSSIVKIDEHSFERCYGLTNLKIPSSVKEISRQAFDSCKGLTELDIPNSVGGIGELAFCDCETLVTVNVPRHYIMGDWVFSGCCKLINIELPERMTKIPDATFNGCKSLKKILIPSGVKSIGEGAFGGCSSLENLDIPSTVTFIGEGAFIGCSSLTSLDIPYGVTKIKDQVFEGCNKLANIKLPSTVTFIGCWCFKNCLSLSEINIPNVSCIDNWAFQGCNNLKAIYCTRSTPAKVNSGAFDGVDKEACILYVPQGTYQDYCFADRWEEFKNIVEYDATGIDNVTTSTDTKEISRYSVNGQRLSAPTKGLNIVKYSDGSVKKVIVQ